MDPWPTCAVKDRLAAALLDLAAVVAISAPVAWLGSITVNREFQRRACGSVHSENYAACVHSLHATLWSGFAFFTLVVVAVVGTAYFGLLQAAAGHATLGERARGVRLVAADQRHPLHRPPLVRTSLRFLFGLALWAPVYVTGVQLWLEPRVGVSLLVVFGAAAVVLARPLVRGLRPEPGTGALLWDRATGTLVVSVSPEPLDSPRWATGP